MDMSTVYIIGIIVLTCLLMLTISLLILYSGLLADIKVTAGKPPIENFTGLYKFGRGSYKDAGPVFTEVVSIAPRARTFGVYYDDPQQVETENLRWLVGCIVAEGTEEPDTNLVKTFLDKDFKQFTFPRVNHAVQTSFPYTSQLSILIGIYRVYPHLSAFVQEKKLCAHPWIEIYDNHIINYMAPLAKQVEFYVPETESEFSDLIERSPDTSFSNDSFDSTSSLDNDISLGASLVNMSTDDESVLDEDATSIPTDTVSSDQTKLILCNSTGDATGKEYTNNACEKLPEVPPLNGGAGDVTNKPYMFEKSDIRQRKVRSQSESAVLSDRKQRIKELASSALLDT